MWKWICDLSDMKMDLRPLWYENGFATSLIWNRIFHIREVPFDPCLIWLGPSLIWLWYESLIPVWYGRCFVISQRNQRFYYTFIMECINFISQRDQRVHITEVANPFSYHRGTTNFISAPYQNGNSAISHQDPPPGQNLRRSDPSPESWTEHHKKRPIPGNPDRTTEQAPHSRKSGTEPHEKTR